jgi:hypothetical protein
MVFLVALAWTNDPALWMLINIGFNFSMSLLGVSVNSHAVLLQKQISINIIGRMHAGWSLGAVGAAITGSYLYDLFVARAVSDSCGDSHDHHL